MIVDPDFLDHWRTRMLVDALGGDEMAPMCLMRLWAHCQVRRADRFEMPAAGLKAQCRFAGDAALFEAALIQGKYIARHGDEIEVLGWAEQNAALLAAWENGNKGGRPRKEPKQNQRVTNGEPNGNPLETQQKPMGNPALTHGEPIREEKSREEEKEQEKTPRKRAPEIPKPEDVAQQTWDDWLRLRAKKSAPVTVTVLQEARKQAGMAGIPLERFLCVWCTRGTQGLEADWLKPSERAGPAGKHAGFATKNYREGIEADGSLL